MPNGNPCLPVREIPSAARVTCGRALGVGAGFLRKGVEDFMAWQDWASAVLAGVGAPPSPTNNASLLGWTAQEKTGLHPAPALGPWATQWNNPLNTTQPWPGAVSVNPVGVKQYRTLADGEGATLATLVNGHYPDILEMLRNSIPAMWWFAAARSQLDTWGTGSVWCDFVPFTEADMTLESDIAIIKTTVSESYRLLLIGVDDIAQPPRDGYIKVNVIPELDAIKKAIAAIPVGGLTAAQATQLQQAHDAVPKMEAALKAAGQGLSTA
jgi:hypothetical protein